MFSVMTGWRGGGSMCILVTKKKSVALLLRKSLQMVLKPWLF